MTRLGLSMTRLGLSMTMIGPPLPSRSGGGVDGKTVELIRGCARLWAPPSSLTVSEWAMTPGTDRTDGTDRWER
jgi:hypothetical protein